MQENENKDIENNKRWAPQRIKKVKEKEWNMDIILKKMFTFIWNMSINWQTHWVYDWGKIMFDKFYITIWKDNTYVLYKFWEWECVIWNKQETDYPLIIEFLETELMV